MMSIVRDVAPSVSDLKQRMAHILDGIRQVEGQLSGDIDPRLIAILTAANGKLDAASQAVGFAACALSAGDKSRAESRLRVARRELEEASWYVAKAEDGSWEDEE